MKEPKRLFHINIPHEPKANKNPNPTDLTVFGKSSPPKITIKLKVKLIEQRDMLANTI